MKKLLFLISLSLMVVTSFGQTYYAPDFEGNPNWYSDVVYIDTISNSNCIWQVGHPTKTVFTSSHSIPNAIVTDTLNPVPANDTSTFYLRHVRMPWPNLIFRLHFWYRMEGDSTDIGIIEVSPDSAHNVWINLLNPDTTYNFTWSGTTAPLMGSTSGSDWKQFGIEFMPWWVTADTVLFRFTYITDSISTARDGWIIDDFSLEDYSEGIQEFKNDNLISIYPNPTTDQLAIQRPNSSKRQTVQIFNYTGQMLYDNQYFSGEIIDTRTLSNGLYILKYSDARSFSIKKFTVSR